jgi:hypothetical protein
MVRIHAWFVRFEELIGVIGRHPLPDRSVEITGSPLNSLSMPELSDSHGATRWHPGLRQQVGVVYVTAALAPTPGHHREHLAHAVHGSDTVREIGAARAPGPDHRALIMNGDVDCPDDVLATSCPRAPPIQLLC